LTEDTNKSMVLAVKEKNVDGATLAYMQLAVR
jgi:hypothetical protein